MYLVIIFLPFFSFLSASLFGRWIGSEGTKRITTSCIVITFLFSSFSFYEVALAGCPTYLKTITWIDCEAFHCSWGFLFDSLTVTMLVVVTSVSSLVHLYSTEYMGEDPHLPRFMSYLSLFTFFMIVLVTGDNYLQLFVGWEGVGLCSYLLINFWFTRLQANKAAIKAMVVNRVGDFGLALGIFGLFSIFQSIDYVTIFAMAPTQVGKDLLFLNTSFDGYTLIGLLLFIGSIGKSAQLGLHTWLPDAMEGPTPVSALIHAATMVTAGVFLLARSSPFFEYTPQALLIVTFIGAMTAFFGASTGLLQNDLKRVIAYSTCSQLGYMVFACGLSNYTVGIFHLGNHAFFKALLFLSAGSVIHAMDDEQDMRKMGGLRRILPFSYAMFVIGSLALMGFPFLTGFYSKDLILECTYAKCTLSGHFAHWLGSLAAFFTAFYSFRLLYLTFLSETNAFQKVLVKAHESPSAMSLPLGILALGSFFTGYCTKDMIVGLGTDFWGQGLFTLPQHMIVIEAEFLPVYIKQIPLLFSVSGAGCSYLFYSFYSKELYRFKLSFFGRKLYIFLNRKWFFDKMYNEYLLQKGLVFSYDDSYKAMDRGFIEMLGPYGISSFVYEKSSMLSRFQSGYLFHYAFVMYSFFLFFVFYLLLYFENGFDLRVLFFLFPSLFFLAKK